MPMQEYLTTNSPGVFDHFTKLDTAATNGMWLSTNDGGTGTLALDSASFGGWIKVPSAGADNDYQLMSSQVPLFKLVAGNGPKPGTSVFFKARFKLTEANTSAANFVFGFSSILTTGFLAADGAGVPASFSGAVIYKLDGGTNLLAACSNGSTQTKDKVLAPFTSGNVYSIDIVIDVNDSTNCRCLFWVQDETAGTYYNPPVLGKGVGEIQIPFASLASLYPVFGVKAGSASAETLIVDYIYAYQNALG